MKKAAPYIIGFVAGVLVTSLVLYLYINTDTEPSDDGLYGLTVFPEKGECIPTDSEIEVFQVLKPNMALAYSHEYYDERIAILVVNYDGKSYYDGQKVKIPAGECARQIGTYQYNTSGYFGKTVPAVEIESSYRKKGRFEKP